MKADQQWLIPVGGFYKMDEKDASSINDIFDAVKDIQRFVLVTFDGTTAILIGSSPNTYVQITALNGVNFKYMKEDDIRRYIKTRFYEEGIQDFQVLDSLALGPNNDAQRIL